MLLDHFLDCGMEHWTASYGAEAFAEFITAASYVSHSKDTGHLLQKQDFVSTYFNLVNISYPSNYPDLFHGFFLI